MFFFLFDLKIGNFLDVISLKPLNNNYFNCCSGGEFGAMMKVSIENDGPVTLEIESPQLPPPKEVSFSVLSVSNTVIVGCNSEEASAT